MIVRIPCSYNIGMFMNAGVFIIRDEFSVGESATASCKSDAPALMIEWLRDGMMVESAAFTSIQELDLVFSPVNDSIHTQVYVCRVTRDGGNGMTVTAVQNFTVNVDGKIIVSINIFLLISHSLFPLGIITVIFFLILLSST